MTEHKCERRRGPSTSALSLGGIIAIASLLASGVATYNAVQNDIATLKRGQLYQEKATERLEKKTGGYAAHSIEEYSCEMVRK